MTIEYGAAGRGPSPAREAREDAPDSADWVDVSGRLSGRRRPGEADAAAGRGGRPAVHDRRAEGAGQGTDRAAGRLEGGGAAHGRGLQPVRKRAVTWRVPPRIVRTPSGATKMPSSGLRKARGLLSGVRRTE